MMITFLMITLMSLVTSLNMSLITSVMDFFIDYTPSITCCLFWDIDVQWRACAFMHMGEGTFFTRIEGCFILISRCIVVANLKEYEVYLALSLTSFDFVRRGFECMWNVMHKWSSYTMFKKSDLFAYLKIFTMYHT